MCAWHVEVRGHFMGVVFLFLPRGSQRSNPGSQAELQVPLLAEPPCQPPEKRQEN